ncbi:MAG: hypothetical protein Q8S33_10605 [Myxococcales bacterium]|nr:hypothetical protein [Myxococcales bacterium]
MVPEIDAQRILEAARDEPFGRRAEILVETLAGMVKADALMVGGRIVAPEIAHEANETLKAIAEELFTGLIDESATATREVVLAVPRSDQPRRINFDLWLKRTPEDAEVVPIGSVSIPTVEDAFGVCPPNCGSSGVELLPPVIRRPFAAAR